MAFDPESRNIGRAGDEMTSGARPPSRVAKSLGRGLEDVSHLFLSNGVDVRDREAGSDRVLERATALPTTRAVIPLRRGEVLTKDQVTTTLRDCPGVLDADMRALDAHVSCPPCGEIDVLVTDGTNQLAIIDVDLAFGDSLLLRGLSHVDWLVGNVSNIRRMYRSPAVDFSGPPRLFLVSLQFSPHMTAAVRQVSHVDVRCFRCQSVDLGSGTGIFFEQIAGDDN
jgi:hypothetical protein